jgi:hypothetical protein
VYSIFSAALEGREKCGVKGVVIGHVVLCLPHSNIFSIYTLIVAAFLFADLRDKLYALPLCGQSIQRVCTSEKLARLSKREFANLGSRKWIIVLRCVVL